MSPNQHVLTVQAAPDRKPYAGKIKVGMRFIWEPDKLHARAEIVVTELKASDLEDGPGGELWIRSKMAGDSGLGPWNEECRFREAVILDVPAAPEGQPITMTYRNYRGEP